VNVAGFFERLQTTAAYSLIRAGEILLVRGAKYRLSSRIDKILEVRRNQISLEISQTFDFTVKYGNFKGMRLANKNIWGASDTACMLLGLYEREISDLLRVLGQKENRRYLIDCGAADGFFAVGALISGAYEFVWAFEMSEQQRQGLKKNAEVNFVQNKMRILGAAGEDFLEAIEKDLQFDYKESTFLIDIEGGEYEILSETNLAKMKDSVLIIELHDFTDEEKAQRISLISRAQKFHNGYLITTGPRDLSGMPELDYLNDSNRWLVCSEGRPRAMDWLVLLPLSMENVIRDLGITHRVSLDHELPPVH
jgi:hypothetical protein